MADRTIPREVDPASIDCYLAYGYVPAPLVDLARRAQAAAGPHASSGRTARRSVERYWRLDYSHEAHGAPRRARGGAARAASARPCGGG